MYSPIYVSCLNAHNHTCEFMRLECTKENVIKCSTYAKLIARRFHDTTIYIAIIITSL